MTMPSDAAEGTAAIAVIEVSDAPCDMGSPPHRAEERPVRSVWPDSEPSWAYAGRAMPQAVVLPSLIERTTRRPLGDAVRGFGGRCSHG